jgi:hypothetical protein
MILRRKKQLNLSEIRRWLPRPFRHGKYPRGAEAAMGAVPERPKLAPSDAKKLAALVRKYGREEVIAAAGSVAARGPGRPSRGLLPYYERMHAAQLLEEYAEEHRKAGSPKPYVDAAIQYYEMEYGTPQRDMSVIVAKDW